MTSKHPKIRITSQSSYNAGRRAERRRIFRLMDSFCLVEDEEVFGEVMSDLYKFIKEGKREYMRNVYGK